MSSISAGWDPSILPIPERAGGPPVLVIPSPLLDHAAGFVQAAAPLLVQALVAEPPVEALDEHVLHRATRRDEVERHLALVPPNSVPMSSSGVCRLRTISFPPLLDLWPRPSHWFWTDLTGSGHYPGQPERGGVR